MKNTFCPVHRGGPSLRQQKDAASRCSVWRLVPFQHLLQPVSCSSLQLTPPALSVLMHRSKTAHMPCMKSQMAHKHLILMMTCRYNKQVLKAYPYPFTCTALQVGQPLFLACLEFCHWHNCARFWGLAANFACRTAVQCVLDAENGSWSADSEDGNACAVCCGLCAGAGDVDAQPA